MRRFGCERRGPRVFRTSEITERDSETRDVDCVLALRLQCVLEVRDAKAARKRLWKPIDNTLVKSFTVVPREVLKSNVDSSIRFDKHACAPSFGRRSDGPKRPWIFILFSYYPEKKDSAFRLSP